MTHPHTKRRLFSLCAALAVTAWSGLALAQPQMTRIIVAFPPGGPVDFVARTLAEQLGKELGGTVVVENKAGANGAIAADFVSRANPDTRTLWLTSVGAVAINPSLYPRLSYNPATDLTPVSLVVSNVEMLVVSAKAPYNTGAEFVAAARKAGAPLTMASSGTGSVPHLAMELLKEHAKIKLSHIPYKGAAPAITDVMAGHVDGFFGDIPGLIGQISAGKLKPIGIAATKRHPRFPDVKTFAEMGIDGVDSDNWYALFAPKATPAADIEAMNQAVKRVLNTPSVKNKLEASGAEVAGSTPAELSKTLAADTLKWSRVVRANGITPD
ncbi:tripartite tricarboxylate transporter substrate binding protein [Pantoea sp. 18069]|uniref:Bug family tripartite tricarboxylate transporter substrate binding protein n=1 Tax=Pantoea sp. 18069 TaxID=2681415 RepID=UPI00135CC838|nr:tripartite tricarboxylate transporter substrate binding protein [Pantoea sp. 18069]